MLARLRVSVGRSPSSSERVEKSNLDLITQPSTTAVQRSLNQEEIFVRVSSHFSRVFRSLDKNVLLKIVTIV